MELNNFLSELQAQVRSEIGDRLSTSSDVYPYAESVFAEVVMQHMSEIGMTFEPHICHYSTKIGNANLKLSGYAVSDESDRLDLFVSLYAGVDDIELITDSQTKIAAEQCLRFLTKCAQGRLVATMDESHDAYELALIIQESYSKLDDIQIYVLTDRQAKAKNFKSRDIQGKTIKLEVMDIERLYRHLSAGKSRDEIVIDFKNISGDPLPCVYIPNEMEDYDYALTVIPGEALRFAYEKYGHRLLEANVRSFLSVTGKVNRGIRDTLKDSPEHFMAYNNGIVIIADEIRLDKTQTGGPGILWLKGMQVVNGGQTTASLYFTKKKNPSIDLSRVRVPAKILVLKSINPSQEEALISDISKYSNTQNSVRQSDLSANKPFHIEIEKLAMSIYCPDGVGRWFYERANGSYKTMLAREGTTPAKLKNIKQSIPLSRKITKTDLAKFLNTWDQLPHIVSLGAQKNFEQFMYRINDDAKNGEYELNATEFKNMIAKTIIFKSAYKVIRPLFRSFQGNVTIYTVSLIANRLQGKIDFDKIWFKQDLSLEFKQQIQNWSCEVNEILNSTARGRMISEWAKKSDCWNDVCSASYSKLISNIPELKK